MANTSSPGSSQVSSAGRTNHPVMASQLPPATTWTDGVAMARSMARLTRRYARSSISAPANTSGSVTSSTASAAACSARSVPIARHSERGR